MSCNKSSNSFFLRLVMTSPFAVLFLAVVCFRSVRVVFSGDAAPGAAVDDYLAAFYVSMRLLDRVRATLDSEEEVDVADINGLVADDLEDEELMVALDLSGTGFSDVGAWIASFGATATARRLVDARERVEGMDFATQPPPMSADEWRLDRNIDLSIPPPVEEVPAEEPPKAPDSETPPPSEPPQPDQAGGPASAGAEPKQLETDSRCAAHPSCHSLSLFCCPTLDNVMLDCCYGAAPDVPVFMLPMLEEIMHRPQCLPAPDSRPEAKPPSSRATDSKSDAKPRSLSRLSTSLLSAPPVFRSQEPGYGLSKSPPSPVPEKPTPLYPGVPPVPTYQSDNMQAGYVSSPGQSHLSLLVSPLALGSQEPGFGLFMSPPPVFEMPTPTYLSDNMQSGYVNLPGQSHLSLLNPSPVVGSQEPGFGLSMPTPLYSGVPLMPTYQSDNMQFGHVSSPGQFLGRREPGFGPEMPTQLYPGVPLTPTYQSDDMQLGYVSLPVQSQAAVPEPPSFAGLGSFEHPPSFPHPHPQVLYSGVPQSMLQVSDLSGSIVQPDLLQHESSIFATSAGMGSWEPPPNSGTTLPGEFIY